jgi:hypothetical protein
MMIRDKVLKSIQYTDLERQVSMLTDDKIVTLSMTTEEDDTEESPTKSKSKKSKEIDNKISPSLIEFLQNFSDMNNLVEELSSLAKKIKQ